MTLPLFVLVLFAATKPATLELACIDFANTGTTCEAVATELRLHGRGNEVNVVDAEETVAASDALFRITLRAGARSCALEVISPADAAVAPRLDRVDCDKARARDIARRIGVMLDEDFDRALRVFEAQPPRPRSAKSMLLSAPGSQAASAASSEPLSAPVPAPSPPPPAVVSERRWHEHLAASGTFGGYGDLFFGGVSVGAGLVTPWHLVAEIGMRGEFRPPLGGVELFLLSPFLRAAWRFSWHAHAGLDLGVQGELLFARSKDPALASPRLFITGGLGGVARVRFPFGVIAPFFEARLLGAFHRLDIEAANVPARSLLPLLWSVGAGAELVFDAPEK